MNNKVDGVSTNSPIPRNRSLVPISIPKAVSDLTISPTKSPPIKPVDPWLHPNLFVGLRNTFVPFETLEKFISWQREKLEKADILKFRNAIKVDPTVKGTIEDLIPVFAKSDADLMSVLRNRLIKSTDFEEKVILLKVFFSTESEDELFNSFFLPALENSKGFENLEANHEFCLYFLSSLDKSSLDNILTRLDFGELTDIETFSQSILKLADPDEVINSLMAINEKLILNDDDSKRHYQVILKTQSIIVLCMNYLGDAPGFISLEHLKTLYKSAIDLDVKGEVADLLAAHYSAEAIKILREQISNTEEDCEDCRQNRFFAIGYFANLMKENAAVKLKEVLDEEKDPFVAGAICYQLASNCGIDGRRALASLIVKQIKKCQESIPLGCAIQLAQYMPELNKTLKNIMCRSYQTDEGLKKAFINLKRVNLCQISKSDDGIIIFHVTPSDNSNPVVDFINKMGLKNMIEWASNSKEDISREEQSLKDNSLEILDYAWNTQRDKMTELVLEIMPLGEDNELKLKSKSLVGVGSFSDDQMSELRPFR